MSRKILARIDEQAAATDDGPAGGCRGTQEECQGLHVFVPGFFLLADVVFSLNPKPCCFLSGALRSVFSHFLDKDKALGSDVCGLDGVGVLTSVVNSKGPCTQIVSTLALKYSLYKYPGAPNGPK